MERCCFWRARISESEGWNGFGVESLGLRIGLRVVGTDVVDSDESGAGEGPFCIFGAAGICVSCEMGVEGWMSVFTGRRSGDLNGLERVTAVSTRRRLVG